MVHAMIGEPSHLIPFLASDSASGAVCSLLYNGLVKYERDLELVGDLAQRWEIREGGLEILFHLRKDVRWHDGVPFTAQDVEFTFRSIMDPKVPTPYRSSFEKVTSMEVLDPWTLSIRYQEPFSPALSSWGMGIIPKHLLEGEDLTKTHFKEHPIGTGPYRFHRWIRGDRVELRANPDYFEGRPYIEWYLFRIIPDQATIFSELQTQGLDSAGLTPLQFSRMRHTPRFDRFFHAFRYPSRGYTYLGYNLKDPKFQDVRVRQAINLAIDKKEILKGVLFGLGEVATGPFPKELWAYNPEIKPAPYDPQRARLLLAQAGWKDTNQDGILDKGTTPFEFTILTNQGNLARELTSQIIQRRLAEVGMRVKIRILEWSSFIHQFIDKRRFEAVLLGWGLDLEPDPYDIWHSSKTKEGEFNFIGYSNPRVDALLEEGRRTFDLKKRREIYYEFHRIVHEEQPVCFLVVPDALPAIHRRFQEVEVSPLGLGVNLIHWFVSRDQQRYRWAAASFAE